MKSFSIFGAPLLPARLSVISALVLLTAVANAAPGNDNFSDRLVLSGTNVIITSSNTDATKEIGETNHAAAFSQTASGMSVWYSWTPKVGGYVAVTLTGNFNKVFAVYTGSAVAGLARVAGGFNNSPYDANGSFVAVAATEYVIAVDGYGYGKGIFTLSLAETPPPPNDNFADRIPLTGTNITVTGANVSASKEPGEPDHAGVAGGQSVWWTWTAPASGWTTVKSSGNFAMLLGVYTGDSVGALAAVAGAKGTSYSVPAVAGFNASAGTVYQIAVDGATLADYSANFSLQVVLLPPPANDNFSNSAMLTGTSVDVYGASNQSATKEPGEPDHAGNPGGHSVWWVWTAPVSGRFAVSSDVWMGSLPPLDRLLGVYSGSAVSALTEVGAASGRSNIVAKANFVAVQGTVYHIAVDGQDGVSGAFNLSLRQPPANDDFIDRWVVGNTNVAIPGTNSQATAEPGEPNHATDSSPPTSAWWKWVAPASGRAVVTVAGSSSQYLGVYTGTNVANLTVVASGNGNGNAPAYANFDAIAGTEYEIAVDGGGGAFSLSVQYVSAPANDAFANRLTVTNTTGANFYVMDSNLGATKEAGETWQGSASVWWAWTAPTNGEILIELESYVYGTTMTFPWLVLFRGTTISNLTAVYPRVEYAGQMHYHDARFTVTAGTTYYVWVASRGGVEGIYTLRGTFEPPPVNDNFTNSTVFTNTPFLYQYGYMVVGAYNVSATKEAGEPWHGGAGLYFGGKSVWWNWTAPYSGRMGVTVSPGRYVFGAIAGVYTGISVSNLTRIANCYSTCTDGSCALTAPIVAGTTYQIVVDGGVSYGDSGEFSLSLSGYFDTNAPSVSITNPPAGQAANGTIVLGGTASDLPGTGAFNFASGVSLVEVRLNGGSWLAATGTNAWGRGVTLVPGANLLEVRARDSVGNYSAIASVAMNYGTWITGLQMKDGLPQVAFPSVEGKLYQVLWTDGLGSPIVWNPVWPEAMPGTGAPLIFTDTNASRGPQRFYRLLVQ